MVVFVSNDVKKEYPHLRQAAKTINFMLMYGGGANRLYESLKSDHSNPLDLGDEKYLEEYHCSKGADVAQVFIDKYFELRSAIKAKLAEYLKQAREEGYVETMFGRRRPTPDVKSSNFLIRTAAERAAQNMPIQGTEADLRRSD